MGAPTRVVHKHRPSERSVRCLARQRASASALVPMAADVFSAPGRLATPRGRWSPRRCERAAFARARIHLLPGAWSKIRICLCVRVSLLHVCTVFPSFSWSLSSRRPLELPASRRTPLEGVHVWCAFFVCVFVCSLCSVACCASSAFLLRISFFAEAHTIGGHAHDVALSRKASRFAHLVAVERSTSRPSPCNFDPISGRLRTSHRRGVGDCHRMQLFSRHLSYPLYARQLWVSPPRWAQSQRHALASSASVGASRRTTRCQTLAHRYIGIKGPVSAFAPCPPYPTRSSSMPPPGAMERAP